MTETNKRLSIEIPSYQWEVAEMRVITNIKETHCRHDLPHIKKAGQLIVVQSNIQGARADCIHALLPQHTYLTVSDVN